MINEKIISEPVHGHPWVQSVFVPRIKSAPPRKCRGYEFTCIKEAKPEAQVSAVDQGTEEKRPHAGLQVRLPIGAATHVHPFDFSAEAKNLGF